MRLVRTFVAAFVVLFASIAAFAEPIAPEKAIERLFTQPLQSDWFASAFLEAVPFPKVAGIVSGLLTQFGAFQSVTPAGEKFTVRLEKAEVPVSVALDAEGKISGLRIEPPFPVAASIQGLVDTIAAFPGKTSIYVTTGGAVRGEHDADAVLAVGSAAKLAIMKVLKDQLAAGAITMDRIVPLDPAWRSLPTGILQDWPEKTPLTVATLANLMISISDNTATDALIDTLGREAIEKVTPRNTPFPKTGELFKLMAPANEALAEAWQTGSAAEKRAVLDKLKTLPQPSAGELKAVDGVEWYFSAKELCGLLDQVADMPALHINAGVAEKADWKDIAFKGGADNGVVSLATRTVGNDGKVNCVAAVWNDDQPVSTDKLATPYRGILHALATAN